MLSKRSPFAGPREGTPQDPTGRPWPKSLAAAEAAVGAPVSDLSEAPDDDSLFGNIEYKEDEITHLLQLQAAKGHRAASTEEDRRVPLWNSGRPCSMQQPEEPIRRYGLDPPSW